MSENIDEINLEELGNSLIKQLKTLNQELDKKIQKEERSSDAS